MENDTERLWRVWVDTRNRIVSFHEVPDYRLMEFRDRELYLRYLTGFEGKNYRYQ